VEPFISTGTVRIQCDSSGAEGLFFKGKEGQTTDSRGDGSGGESGGGTGGGANGTGSRWVEVTVVVVGPKHGLVALDPSLTVVASGAILSLEDKFQGGTGVNITPLPPSIVSSAALAVSRERIASAANALGIEGFARIDAFLHVDTGEVMAGPPSYTSSTPLSHHLNLSAVGCMYL